jgi:heterodisulfide reductase subunit C
MKDTSLNKIATPEGEFTRQVKEQSGVNIDRCFQCLTCTLSCPSSFTMDYLPNQLIRKIQAGARDEVLHSRTIWRCISCETCVTRCPNEINIPRLMDTLRQMAVREKITPGDKNVPAFHAVFIESIRQWGRQYELGMLLLFKIKTRDFFSDIGLGMKMLQKGKLGLLPGKNSGRQEIKAIFNKLKEMD